MKKTAFILFILISLILTGCKVQNTSLAKLRDLDFTVVDEATTPNELKQLIDERKGLPFKLSYSDNGYLYLVTGYGEQLTGGYSIQVTSLYETENAICLNTDLIGPSKGEAVAQVITYPYIVVKLEYIDKRVVFE